MGSFGDGSDGELVFTTTTKSYGNLVLNTDYQVSGNVLYFTTQHIYQFTDFEIGSGCSLKIMSSDTTTTRDLIIYVQNESNIRGVVDIQGTQHNKNILNLAGNGGAGGRTYDIYNSSLSGGGAAKCGGGGAGGSTYAHRNSGSYSSPYCVGGGGGTSSNNPDGSSAAGGYVWSSQYSATQTSSNGSAGTAGGGGGGSASQVTASGSSTNTSTGGGGGASNTTVGGNGGSGASGSTSPAGVATYALAAGGAGGAGGTSGKPGLNLILYAKIAYLSGIFYLSGQNGGNGGTGGNGNTSRSGNTGIKVWASGGAGGGGGGGGDGGSLTLYYTTKTDTSTKYHAGGSGGTAGGAGSVSFYDNAGGGQPTGPEAGTNGSSGSNGSFSELKILDIDDINNSLSLSDFVSKTLTTNVTNLDTFSLTDFVSVTEKSLADDTISLSDSIYREVIHPIQSVTDNLSLTDSVNALILPAIPNKTSIWLYHDAKWNEIEVSQFVCKKKLNNISEFEFKLDDVTDTLKENLKEFATILISVGTSVFLKGRVQIIEYGTDYGCVVKGFGMEAKLLEKIFIKNGDLRVQYINESAKEVAEDLIGTTMSYQGDLFTTDYGNVNLRFEYANKLSSLNKLSSAIGYDWWVSHSEDYTTDYLNISQIRGT